MKRFVTTVFLFMSLVPTIASAASLESSFLSLVKKTGINASDQAVCVQDATGTSLVSHNTQKSIIPASVSKLYTFDWALSKLPIDFRYTTTFYQDGRKLYVNGGGDPHFVVEHLREVLAKINSEKKVTIDTITFSPEFYYNWKSTPTDVRIALLETFASEPELPVAKNVKVVAGTSLYKGKGTKYELQSMPLPVLIKQINNYSTNISADTLFRRLGGSVAFSDYMKKTYGVGPDTIFFETGSGLSGNHTTCALTLKVIAHLSAQLKEKGLTITDIMSMPNVDPGVLSKRTIDAQYVQSLVAKSGFVNFHHALAGAINTKAGLQFFAVFTEYPDMKKGDKTKEMIDKFVTEVLKSEKKVLASFKYEPDLSIFKNIKIVKL